jgi:hypothetical protein
VSIRIRFFRTFLEWLEEARPRLSVLPRVSSRTDSELVLKFDGMARVVALVVEREPRHPRRRFNIRVMLKDVSPAWGAPFYSSELIVEDVAGGFVDERADPATREVYLRKDKLWRDLLFEPLVPWLNETLAPADAIALGYWKGGPGIAAMTGEPLSGEPMWLPYPELVRDGEKLDEAEVDLWALIRLRPEKPDAPDVPPRASRRRR